MDNELKKEMKQQRDYYIKQYEKTHKQLKIECDNLKELMETVDPLNIDFDSKVDEINNLKTMCNRLHYRIVSCEALY